ncbi:MAG: endo-1,4-beta-xylanase [Treponema sp.]|nr:endo-1,4-beta-xylanase [Treponema sp.]
MKKLSVIIAALLITAALSAAPNNGKKNANYTENQDGTLSITNVDKDASVKKNQKVDGYSNVITITGSKVKKVNPVTVDLSAFAGKEVMVNLSCDIKVNTSDNSEVDIIWMINDMAAGMPVLVQQKVKSGEWTTLKGEAAVPLSENKSLYISGAGINLEGTVLYLKDFEVKLSGEGLTATQKAAVNWSEAPSLKEAYKDYFDYIGFACSLRPDLNNPEVTENLSKHATSITLGNEFKPDFLFNWARPYKMEDFVAEDGKTYQVPMGMPSMGNAKEILFNAMEIGVNIRGHVLVWHQQTPAWFFREDCNDKNPLTDKATMNARLEWYIKTVMAFIAEFEKKYNGGQHIITVWDVVNEAVADNAGSQKWLRTDSDWYRIYGNEEFIINAFRYANKYAPKDVLLVYNDYNCYSTGKCNAICNLIDEIRAVPDARIDAIGMQSHVSMDYPAVKGNNSYETAVQKFIAKDIDIQVTELDIANGSKSYSPTMLKAKYKEYYKLFIKYRKTAEKHGISGVTIWGLTDNGTWLNDLDQYKGHTQYPLLMDENFNVKPAFYGVLEAAE